MLTSLEIDVLCRALIVLAVASVIPGCSSPKSDDIKVACDVAGAHASTFQKQAARPIAIVSQPSYLKPPIGEVETFLRDTLTAGGRAAVEKPEASPVARCPALRKMLSDTGVIIDDSRIAWLTRSEIWPIEVLRMSVPVVSADGRTATLYVSEYMGPLSGGVSLVTYRQDRSGAWVIARKQGLMRS
jgi:hypothetical protein